MSREAAFGDPAPPSGLKNPLSLKDIVDLFAFLTQSEPTAFWEQGGRQTTSITLLGVAPK